MAINTEGRPHLTPHHYIPTTHCPGKAAPNLPPCSSSMVLSNRIILCIVLHAIGTARLSLSSIDEKLPEVLVQKSYRNPFSDVNAAKPRDEMDMRSHLQEPLKFGKLDHNLQAGGHGNDELHGEIPQGLEGKKLEMEQIVTGRNDIVERIDKLDPDSNQELVTLKSTLLQLCRSFRTPAEERVRQLGGMDPAVNPEPSATGYAAGGRDNLALSRPFLEDSDSTESEPLISSDQRHHTLTFEPLPADETKKPKTVLEAHLAEKKIPIHNLERPTSYLFGLSHGDEYELGKGLTDPDKIKTWNFIQEKLNEFKSSDKVPSNPKEVRFRIDFIKAFNRLGDHVLRNRLLTSTESIDSFKSETVMKMVEMYGELEFKRLDRKFFVSRMSFVPDLDFLTSGWDMRHFHRSIKSLSAQDQEKVVHAIMGKVLSHTREFFSSRGSQLSEPFTKIHHEFNQPEFLEQAHSLSLALKDEDVPATINHLMNGSPIASFTEKLIDFFKNPEMKTPDLEQRRIEYQLVYYMLNFLDRNHPQIISKTVKRTENILPMEKRDKHRYVFEEQLEFMRGYLKQFPNQNRDDYYTGEAQDLSRFGKMVLDSSGKFHLFRNWIDTYVVKIFDHTDWINWSRRNKRLQFDLWMGKLANKKT
ncbi:hypothetical protein PSHT_08374 [Puccinia striiformis]|uniref:Uncharacterized protein n=1 Tax=Puccinia striiformis TaxID=27350 RepID=A0A2S4VPG2_9BASI|nr:hypothetical protein PSHT_08374 [Puccinia striiformis]